MDALKGRLIGYRNGGSPGEMRLTKKIDQRKVPADSADDTSISFEVALCNVHPYFRDASQITLIISVICEASLFAGCSIRNDCSIKCCIICGICGNLTLIDLLVSLELCNWLQVCFFCKAYLLTLGKIYQI